MSHGNRSRIPARHSVHRSRNSASPRTDQARSFLKKYGKTGTLGTLGAVGFGYGGYKLAKRGFDKKQEADQKVREREWGEREREWEERKCRWIDELRAQDERERELTES